MKYIKYCIPFCICSLVSMQMVGAQPELYGLDDFLSKRLSLAEKSATPKKISSIIQKSGVDITPISNLDTSISKGAISLSFKVPKIYGESIFPANYFLKEPSGLVKNMSFSGAFVSKSGFLVPGEQASLNVEIKNEGRYVLSVSDVYGFSVLQKEFQIGNSHRSVDSNITASPLERINQIRNTLGYKLLKNDLLLQKIAKNKIEDMLKKKYFGHEDGSGNNLVQRISNIRNMMLGENIARSTDKDDLQKSLESSPSHRYNMQFSDWSKVGIALQKGPDNMWYMVQIFSK